MENMMSKICVLVPLLLLLPSACEGMGDLRRPKYIHNTNFMTWNEAKLFCRTHHTDLVTIASAKENQHFINGGGWIGLRRQNRTSPWKWFRNKEVAEFTIWDAKGDSFGNCAFKYPKVEEWSTHPCYETHSFMCFDETLVLVKKNKTWEQALEHCRTMEALNRRKPATVYNNYRYDLATLMSPDDHDYAREISQDATTDEMWTGLRFLAGHWLWVGGERVQYDGIGSCPAHMSCGVLKKNGTTPFKIRDCTEKRNFLCYRKN